MGKYIRLYCEKSMMNKPGQEKGKGDAVDGGAMKHARLIITGKDPKQIEVLCQDIIRSCEELKAPGLPVTLRGPRKMPNKTLRITTRKSPCGNGTNTFDKYELRIHKRIIDIRSPNIHQKVGSLIQGKHITEGVII